MEFLKKNYEKVLLGIVLLGATVCVALLPFIISGKRKALEEVRTTVLNRQVKELPPLSLARHDAAVARAQAPVRLNFSGNITWLILFYGKRRRTAGLLKL